MEIVAFNAYSLDWITSQQTARVVCAYYLYDQQGMMRQADSLALSGPELRTLPLPVLSAQLILFLICH